MKTFLTKEQLTALRAERTIAAKNRPEVNSNYLIHTEEEDAAIALEAQRIADKAEAFNWGGYGNQADYQRSKLGSKFNRF